MASTAQEYRCYIPEGHASRKTTNTWTQYASATMNTLHDSEGLHIRVRHSVSTVPSELLQLQKSVSSILDEVLGTKHQHVQVVVKTIRSILTLRSHLQIHPAIWPLMSKMCCRLDRFGQDIVLFRLAKPLTAISHHFYQMLPKLVIQSSKRRQ